MFDKYQSQSQDEIKELQKLRLRFWDDCVHDMKIQQTLSKLMKFIKDFLH